MTKAMPTVLSRSLSTELQVGANRRGSVSGAGWLYALPRLGFGRILCVGAPSSATLAGLARAGVRVEIIEHSRRTRERVVRDAPGAGLTTVRCAPDEGGIAPGADHDLVEVSEAESGRDADLVARILARLAPDGLAVVPGPVEVATTRVAAPERSRLAVALTPGRGDVRSTVPAADAAMRQTIDDLGLAGRWIPHPRAARFVHRWPAAVVSRLAGGLSRTAIILGPTDAVGPEVPAYVREIAGDAGRDLAGWGWGVAARGDYDSQKVLMLLRPPGATRPSGLVKITRASAHRARLENEGRALEQLVDLPLAAGRVPAPWFAGTHAGRAVLGESMIDGEPFTSVARWEPTDPHLGDAAGWLTDLGAATRVAVPATVVATALMTLLERYADMHRPTTIEHAALRDRFEALGQIDLPIPTVFQHGDPGIWNLLVDGSGRTVFLDWEAAETDGLPLWDLLYLVRSYAIATSRRAGVRDRLEAATRHLLDGSPLGDRIVDLVATYRERVGLPAAAVEALIYGCWVHRSLKEATRMAPDRLADGQFVRLIRRMLAAPEAPVLVRLRGRGS
jgi:hypothetical protein